MAIVLESAAIIGNYPSQYNLPAGIQAGDLLIALNGWGDETLEALPGFTIVDSIGVDWDWTVLQYRVADGSEGSTIVPDPAWAAYWSVIARVSGVDTSDPINVAHGPEQSHPIPADSKTVELDSVSPDAANTGLITLAFGTTANTPTGFTFEGGAFDISDLTETYGGGVSFEPLESSGATGTRTITVTRAPNQANVLYGALVALNPVGGDPPPDPPAAPARAWPGLLLPI